MLTLSARNLAITAFAVATTLSASSAFAENFLASATRASNATGTAVTFVPLADSGATSLAFTTTANSKLVKITYNAECSNFSPSAGSYTSISIFVDGVQAAPASGTSFAFCTEPVANSNVWTGAVRQSLISVPLKGAHSLQVQVTAAGGGSWWLGDSSVVVEQK